MSKYNWQIYKYKYVTISNYTKLCSEWGQINVEMKFWNQPYTVANKNKRKNL